MLQVTNALSWLWNNKRTAFELALVLALTIGGWRYNRQQAAADAALAVKDGLAADLRQQIKLVNGQLEITRRENDGKIVYKKIYVPPEGSVVISQKDEESMRSQLKELADKLAIAKAAGDRRAADALQDQMDHLGPVVDVTVHNKGLTLKPGYGLDWSNHGIKPRLDVKFFFWNRYSAIVGGGMNGVGPSVSRHIDDIMWGHPQNVEIFAGYNFFRFQSTDAPVVVGIRSNF